MTRSRRYTLTEIFAVPLVLAVFTIVGLIAALLGDGWRRRRLLGRPLVPTLTIVWALIWRRS